MGKGMDAREQTTAGREYRTTEEAVQALQEALQGVDNPVAAARALRRVATRYRPQHDGPRDAFRWEAEEILRPHFRDSESVKSVVWSLIDEAKENDRGFEAEAGPGNVNESAIPRSRSLAEILRNPQATALPEAIEPRLAYRGRSTLLAAREKRGKSTLASAGASAVSRGRLFLGEPCFRGPVLWVGLEEHVADVARRFKRFDADPDEVYILDRLADPFGTLEAEVTRVSPVLIVLDTLAAFVESIGPDPGSASAWTPIIGRLVRLARDSDAALLILHHARKSDGRYRDSSAIGAGVDVVLEMSEDAGDAWVRKFKAKARWYISDFAVRLLDSEPPHYELAGGEHSLDARVHLYVESSHGCSTNDVKRNVTGKGSAILAALNLLAMRGAIYKEEDGVAHRWFPNRVQGCSETSSGNAVSDQSGSRENPQGLATDPVLGLGARETGPQSQPHGMGPGTRSREPQPGFDADGYAEAEAI